MRPRRRNLSEVREAAAVTLEQTRQALLEAEFERGFRAGQAGADGLAWLVAVGIFAFGALLGAAAAALLT